MRHAAFALLFALAALPAAAANLGVKDAAAHAGQNGTVVGVLSNVHQNASKMVFLDLGGVYPDNAFSAVIFPRDAGKFHDFAPLTGKTLAITGKIKMYQNKPEIVLNTPDQVKVVH
jgi:exonuclease VII large subunit